MDIIVKGEGKKYFRPNEVKINLEFYVLTSSYELALQEGTRNVEIFIDKILNAMNISKEELKTRSFRVYEDKRYDYDQKIYISNGFVYTQSAMLKFDYDKEFMAKFMDKVSRLENPPKYSLVFCVKNEQQTKNEAMADAYNNAKEKAKAIAEAAGKTLKECIKIDFRPFEESVYSGTRLESNSLDIRYSKAARTQEDVITNIFTPEDIEISETLYCLWIAE